ncbi:protein of unknown function [Magnetospirillum gryphiswaldense MSR-1 v2]|uniref:Secreted protein n=2 Tax=Magnetospirillum gryphiswaldense TaxID=55518 RepID=V6F2H2_MAGGM|nr:hypothetical protein [Magnetospirillum gryphiswaldense]CAM78247.1 hypothetical protein MGR_P0018 [Magnetospirillum gryphiswaldense MSR-1]CDK99143.1 protein of unknown function [Magnetospirillum gryphiswaldense MSR-1 v2]CDK99649.1 protein of unknown function [Magnetospirillum gryphiswaldense MSR-1 v2]
MRRIWAVTTAFLAFTSSAMAESDCELAKAAKDIAIEVERFSTPGQRRGIEDVARLLVPSPCKTSPAPRLVLENVELGLLAEDWRRGTEELEQRRLDR